MTRTCLAGTGAVLLIAAATLAAQDRRPPARLARVEGVAFLDDRLVLSAEMPTGLPARAVIRTEAGRVLINLKVGGTLALDERTTVRVHENGVYNFNRIDVIAGRVIVETGASNPEVHCPDHPPVGPDSRTSQNLVRLSSKGRYRFERRAAGTSPPEECLLRVQEGAAAVPATSLLLAARPGQEVRLPYGDMIPVREFTVGDLDAFDRWARARGRP